MLEANLTATKVPGLLFTSTAPEFLENLQTHFALAEDMRHRTQDVRKFEFMSSKMVREWHTPAWTSYSSSEPDESTAEMLRRVSNALSALDGIEADKTSPSHRT